MKCLTPPGLHKEDFLMFTKDFPIKVMVNYGDLPWIAEERRETEGHFLRDLLVVHLDNDKEGKCIHDRHVKAENVNMSHNMKHFICDSVDFLLVMDLLK